MQDLMAQSPDNHMLGHFDDFADLLKQHADLTAQGISIPKLLAQGRLRVVPTTANGKGIGVDVYLVNPPWENQRTSDPITLRDAVGFDARGNPIYQTRTIPAGAVTNKEAFALLGAQAKEQMDSSEKAFQMKNTASRTRAENTKDYSEAAAAQANAGSKNDELAVAYDPTYQNADGSKGANVVMPRGQARQNGLQHYKADPSTINATIGGFNDVQTKVNMLADVANNPDVMNKVNPELAAAMLADGKGIEVGAFGTKVDLARVNEGLYADDVKAANAETRAYVTAMVAAHEAITQLPRLQTFGTSNRMTEKQMEAAQNMLPARGRFGHGTAEDALAADYARPLT